jgi:hypothetical protein
MKISRRGFLAGLTVAGAAVPAAYYAHRELTRPDFPVTPGEASFDVADARSRELADSLRGIWEFQLLGAEAGLDGLPVHGLQLLLDVAPRGRGVRGVLDTAENLRTDAMPRYQLLGDLAQSDSAKLSWRLTRSDSPTGNPDYELSVVLDEVWAAFGNAGSATLNGQILRLDRPLALPLQDNRFVAVKRLFPEARERIALEPELLARLINPEHRLFHQLWHASRDKWHKLSSDQQDALRGIGWQPGPREHERDARGPKKDRNGSGVDFLFMHRHMLGQARAVQALPSWRHFPLPRPELMRDRQGFARYFDPTGARRMTTTTASGSATLRAPRPITVISRSGNRSIATRPTCRN